MWVGSYRIRRRRSPLFICWNAAVAIFLLLDNSSRQFELSLSSKAHAFSPATISGTKRKHNVRLSASGKVGEGIGVGIDLGTTFSAISILGDDDKPQIVPIPKNGRTMPSVVAFDDNSNPLVGRDAIEWEETHQVSAYRHVKRIIGTGAEHIPEDTSKVVPHLAQNILDNGKGKKHKKKKKVSLEKRLKDAEQNPAMLLYANDPSSTSKVSPITISSLVVQKLLDTVREQTNKEITRAVVGVPAYFNDAQREATTQAVQMAGIPKVKLLREPEAAALAYGVDQDVDGEELVLVFDLGGGTYDVSMLLVSNGLTEIICTAGDAQLGGTNFDAKVAQYITHMAKGSVTAAEIKDVVIRAAERVRIYLSNQKQVNLAIPLSQEGWLALQDESNIIVSSNDPDFVDRESNSTHTFCVLTRKEMEALCKDEFLALVKPIREVAIMAGAMLPGDARPGIVDSALEMESALREAEKFYDDDDDDNDSKGPTEKDLLAAQAELDLKAARKAQQKGRQKARKIAKDERKYRAESRKVAEESVTDVKVRGDGISGRPISQVVLVGGATRMPAIGRLIGALSGVVPQKTVDPDEAVSLGCAVHVGVLDGKEGMGTVLNPMQAAILRAVVEKQQREEGMILDDDFDDEEFGDFETIEFN